MAYSSSLKVIHPTIKFNLKPGDVNPYDTRSSWVKNEARKRAIRLIENLTLDRTETSILPSHLIIELWNTHTSSSFRIDFKLITETSFDMGSVFRIVRNR